MCRPSLKITRNDDREHPGDVSFEVWDPIKASYEPMASLKFGLIRMEELAARVWIMWVQQNPARAFLKDAPDPGEDDDTEWAELRVSAQPNRVDQTRAFHQHEWTTAIGRTVAIQRTCNEVGYVPP